MAKTDNNPTYSVLETESKAIDRKIWLIAIIALLVLGMPLFATAQTLEGQGQNEPNFSILSKLINIETAPRIQNFGNAKDDTGQQLESIKIAIDSVFKAAGSLNTTIKEKQLVFSQPAYPSITFPSEISIRMTTAPGADRSELLRSQSKLNQSISTLNSSLEAVPRTLDNAIKKIPNGKPYVYVINNKDGGKNDQDYSGIILRLAYCVILFYVILFLSRLLRYYIKLSRHYKDRRLAFQLKEEVGISIEDAMMIISSSHIDFTVPKMPSDILTQYYANKGKSNCKSCCCCCCQKKCSEEKKQKYA